MWRGECVVCLRRFFPLALLIGFLDFDSSGGLRSVHDIQKGWRTLRIVRTCLSRCKRQVPSSFSNKPPAWLLSLVNHPYCCCCCYPFYYSQPSSLSSLRPYPPSPTTSGLSTFQLRHVNFPFESQNPVSTQPPRNHGRMYVLSNPERKGTWRQDPWRSSD